MQCPTCLEELPKRFYRPSQWAAFSPVAGDYFQCKICDGDFPRPESQHPQHQQKLQHQ